LVCQPQRGGNICSLLQNKKSEVQRTGKIILPVRCTSNHIIITYFYKYYRRAAAGKPKNG